MLKMWLWLPEVLLVELMIYQHTKHILFAPGTVPMLVKYFGFCVLCGAAVWTEYRSFRAARAEHGRGTSLPCGTLLTYYMLFLPDCGLCPAVVAVLFAAWAGAWVWLYRVERKESATSKERIVYGLVSSVFCEVVVISQVYWMCRAEQKLAGIVF